MQSTLPATEVPAVAPAPVAIGGMGGSGTRVVSAAAIALGVDMGSDLNRALDNLGFTLLFKDQLAWTLPADAFAWRTRIFADAMAGNAPLSGEDLALLATLAATGRGGEDWVQHQPAWLAERADRLAAMAARPAQPGRRWGWKEPNTQVLLHRLEPLIPGLRYVHVSRDPLDMAFSRNTNQMMFWGPQVLRRRVQPTPRDMLAFWCELDRRARRMAEAMGRRYLRLEHAELCASPVEQMARLAGFLDADTAAAPELALLVRSPPTVGRHRGRSRDEFAQEDLDYLASIGEASH